MSDSLKNRQYGVKIIYGILLFLLLVKLSQLQVFSKKYGKGIDSVAVIEKEVIPSRGLIFDRNDSLIVYNAPVYDIYFVLNKLDKADSCKIADFLGIQAKTFTEKVNEARKKKFYKKPFPLLKRLSEEDYAYIQEDLYQFPALTVKMNTERRYRYPNAAMILGYMGEVNDREIKASDHYYKPRENIGKKGVEKSFEKQLRGEKGTQFLLRDKNNVLLGSYENGVYDKAAIPGQDMRTTIDIELQNYAERLMNGKVGSLVAIEPSTGEILTMVSSPTYDPNWLTGRQRNDYFNALRVDSLKPLFNRAVSAEYPPGSTFKPLASLIGLEIGAVDEHFQFPCNGGYSLNKGKPGCHAHPHLRGVRDAIKQSCNAYYAENFRRTLSHPKYQNDTRKALNDWYRYMTYFGYDTKFDIGIGGVKDGFFPQSDMYDRMYPKWNWKPLTIISLSIGQGEMLATTLQMAQSVSVIANRGNAIAPHLAKSFSNEDVEKKHIQAPIQKRHFEAVIDGMELTFLEGTARGSKIDHISACGKTGTAENFTIIDGKKVQLKDHSLFVAFAPKENPKIAVAIIIENGGYGSTYAAPISSLVIEKHISDTISQNRKYLEKRMLEANLIGFEKENYLEYVAAQQERAKLRKIEKAEQKRLDSIKNAIQQQDEKQE